MEDRRSGWTVAAYRKSEFIVRQRLQPALELMDMRALSSRDVVPVLRDLADRSPSIASKARQCLNGVVRYCILRGISGDDQVLRLHGALPKHRGGHIPVVTKLQGVGPLMRAVLLLAAYSACHPGVVASARWEEMDLDLAEWTISVNKMKMRIEHVVSLLRQAVSAVVILT